MDALLTTFLAALLAEFGDKTQLFAMALAARYGRPAPIILGIAVAAIAHSILAATGGVLLNDLITFWATSLLVALALVFSGVSGLIGQKRPDMGSNWKVGAFVTAATGFFLLEMGDKTQFLTAALAAQFDSLGLAAAGAAAGIFAANVPGVFLAERLGVVLPLRWIRIGAALIFLLAGFLVAINALRLI